MSGVSDEKIQQLCGLTGMMGDEAEQYLSAANGDVQLAAGLFFDDSSAQAEADQGQAPAPPQQTGGARTLGGAYVPPSSSSQAAPSRTAKQPAQRGPRTLKDLQSANAGGDGDSADDDDKKHQHDFFTGGEKSGLAVENPNKKTPQQHIDSILKRARENAARLGGDDDDDDHGPQTASRFRGAGVTLGGDDAPSRVIPDPHGEAAQAAAAAAPRVRRALHLWDDGFSVDDGPLFRYDDPANARTLEMINAGHAPLHLLDVQPDQEVDVVVLQHPNQKYQQPKKKYVPFSGSGQRLGSPTPGATFTPPPAPATTTSATPAAASPGPAQPSVQVDSSAPVITLQIRLGDGTRLQSRFNTTHTVGDVYSFVNAGSPASTQRSYTLMTTFPSKELSDKSKALGDVPEFKRGGVVVQKWT